MSNLVTAAELATLLRVSTTWVVNRAKSGELPAYKVGHLWRFDADQVADWLNLLGNRATYDQTVAPRRVLPPRQIEPMSLPPYPIALGTAVEAQEVAERLRVTNDAAKRWIRSGLLPGLKVGRRWVADRACLERWLEVLDDHPTLEGLEPGRTRTESITRHIQSYLLSRWGVPFTPDSWRRRGGRFPSWAEVLPPGSLDAPR